MDTPLLNHLTSEDYDHVYEPAEDSFLLLDALEEDLEELRKRKPPIVLELGPGSGINITALSKALPDSFCLGIDINQYACRTTNRTAVANVTWVDVLNGDLLRCLLPGSIDLLIFNPPYVPTNTLGDEEEFNDPSRCNGELVKSWAGGVDGCDVINRLFEELKEKLAPGSLFYLLLLKENDPLGIQERMLGLGLKAAIVRERKIRGEHLFIMKIEKH